MLLQWTINNSRTCTCGTVIKTLTAYGRQLRSQLWKLRTLKRPFYWLWKMPKVPAHLCECALGMLQGGMRTADVARAINCNVRTVRSLRQLYGETGRTADHPRSGKPRVTTPAQDRYIRTSHLRDRYRMATTTARVTPGTHNPSVLRLSTIGWERMDWGLVGLL